MLKGRRKNTNHIYIYIYILYTEFIYVFKKNPVMFVHVWIKEKKNRETRKKENREEKKIKEKY